MQVVHVCHAAYQRAAPIQNNGSVAGLNETEQRYQQRALAAACAADNSNLGRVRQLEGDTIKGRRKLGRIFQADVFELRKE